MSDVLVNTGSVIAEPNDTTLTALTVPPRIEMGGTAGVPATVIFTGDSAITPANPTFGPGVLVDAQIAGQTTAEQSLLDLLGISVNAGTIAADGPAGSTFTIDVAANGTIIGNFVNTGTLAVLAGNEMLLAGASGSTVSSTGTVSVAAGGTLAIDNAVLGGTVVNNGSILVVGDGTTQAGTVEVSGALSGTGTLDIGTNGILKLDAPTTQSIAFPTGGAAILILPGPGTYSMPLLNLNTGDKIEIVGAAPVTGVTASGGTITVVTMTGDTVLTDASFATGAVQSAFGQLPDSTTGDQAVRIVAPIDTWSGGVSSDLGTAGNWAAGVPTSADLLEFNDPQNLSGVVTGLAAIFGGFGGVAWGLQGATLTLAGEPNPPFDPYALGFGGNVTLNGATVIAGGTSSFGSNIQGVTVTAQGGSAVTTAGDSIAQNAGEFASLVLAGIGTTWTEFANPADAGNGYSPGFLTIGQSGTGALSVSDGASLGTGAYAIVGENAGAIGTAAITSAGNWATSGLIVGQYSGSEGQVAISGSTVTDTQNLEIGDNGGDGQVTISAGGTLAFSGTFAAVGNRAGSSGRLVIGSGGTLAATAPPASTSASYLLNIGEHDTDGVLPAASGSVFVNGAGALLDLDGNGLSLGLNGGQGSLAVSNGGTVKAGTPNSNNVAAFSIGKVGLGNLTITGAGSALLATGGVYDGRGGTGNVLVANGGLLSVSADPLGNGGFGVGLGDTLGVNATGGSGSASVTSNGRIYTQNGIGVGGYGVNGVFNVSNGGSVEVGTRLGIGQGGTIGTLALGGVGAVNIGAGGTIQVDATAIAANQAAIFVGDFAGAQGSVNVGGAGAVLNVGTQMVRLGTSNSGVANSSSGAGALSVSQGGVVNAGSIGVGYTGQGSLSVSNGGSVAIGTALNVGQGLLVGTLQSAGFGVVDIGAGGTINVAGTGLAAGVAAVTAGSYLGATGIINVSGSQAILNLNGHDLRLGTNSGTPSLSGAGSLSTTFGGEVFAGTIVVGDTGIGSFNANIGGASASVMDVGAQGGAQGNINLTSAVTGVGLNTLTIGDQGLGRVADTAGANLVAHLTTTIGNAAGSDGQLAVTSGAHFRTQTLIDGQSGTGALTISGGATGEVFNAATIGFGGAGGAGLGSLGIGVGGTLTVDGTGLGAGVAAVSVGAFANAIGLVSVTGSQAVLNAGTHDIGLGTNIGNAASSGTGILTAALGGEVFAGTIVVGDTGTGVFSANIGGASASAIDLGAQATGQGSMLLTGGVTGVGLNALTVGDKGYGKVTVTNSANLVVHGNVVLGNAAGATGQVAIASNAYFQANTLTVGGSGSGALSVDSAAVVNALNAATIGATGALTLQGGKLASAQLTNQANIAGSGIIIAPLVNNGVVTSTAGLLSMNGAISGTGVLAMTSNSELVVGAVGAGQQFAFSGPAVLQLGNLAGTSAGVIAGFGVGDQIQVVTAGSISTSFNSATDALTITTGAASQTFQVTGAHTAADFASTVVGVDTLLAANQTVNLGTGPHLLFLGGSSTGDTIVAPALPAAGTSNFLDISGYGGTDTLDFRAALAGTTWDGSNSTIGNYLSVGTSGNSAVISLSQTSGGPGTALVKLENSGPMTLSQVLAHATI